MVRASRQGTVAWAALRPVLFFVVFSALWITLTDELLGWMIRDKALLVRLSMGKGFVYILVVASVLFWMIHRALGHQRRLEGERQEAREERDALKVRFGVLSSSLNDIVLLVEASTGKVLWVNDRALEAYGYAPEEMESLTLAQLRGERDPQQWLRQMEEVRKAGSLRFRTTHLRRDGTAFPVEVSSRYFESEGRPLIQSVIRDISERVEARRALEESERRLRVLFEQTEVGIVECTLNGQILRANPAFCRLLGRTEAELCQGNFAAVTDPEHIARDLQGIQALRERGQGSYRVVKRYIRKDGTKVWARVLVGLLKDASGQADHFVTVVQDIDAWRQADESLQESMRFLQEAQEAGHVGLYCWNIQENTWTSSSEMNRIFGIDPSFPRTIETWVEIVAPDWRQRMADYVTQLLQAREPFDLDYQIQRPCDGAVRWVHGRGLVDYDPEGRPLQMKGVIQDISERKEAEAALLRMNEELESRVEERTRQLEMANQELEAFSYSVSHDLRAPLRAVDGFSLALEEDFGAALPPEAHHFLERIRGGAARMGQLIEDLLRLSKINRAGLERVEVDLGRMAEDVLQDLATRFPDRQVQVVVQDSLRAMADGRLMQVLLENLLSNAWKFTSKTPEARIEVGRMMAAEGRETWFIRDNGAGFEPSQAARLFKPFTRLHAQTDFEGTGIGLAIVQRIVARHGGEVWAESAPGKETTFYWTLPKG